MKTLLTLAMLAGWGTGVCAACGGGTTVLTCRVGSGTLTACVFRNSASLTYGREDAPTVSLKHPLSDIRATPWPGVGSAIYEEIVFSKADVEYMVWTSLDRLQAAGRMSGGLMVSRDGRTLTEVQCRAGTAQVQVFAVPDALEEAGFCWDRAAQQWDVGCN